MTARDHERYEAEVGAYLLGALTDLERQAFERHMAGCPACRNEIERLRPAADALPRSVEQVEPPPALKTSLMQIVEREAAEVRPGRAASRKPPWWRPVTRLPTLRLVAVAGALLLGLAVGFGAAQLGGDDDPRTLAATVDEGRLPQASGMLRIEGDGDDGAILRVQGMPSLEAGRVYQAWVARDGAFIPQPTFEVGPDGGGAVAVPDDLSGADAVLVTREQRGGARAPSERPVLSVSL